VKIIDEETEEILVDRNEARGCVEVHIRGANADDYRTVRLDRQEARRLAALILFQADKLGRVRLVPAVKPRLVDLKTA
jgi:hypothetical protein